jgi:hypothetical protein
MEMTRQQNALSNLLAKFNKLGGNLELPKGYSSFS